MNSLNRALRCARRFFTSGTPNKIRSRRRHQSQPLIAAPIEVSEARCLLAGTMEIDNVNSHRWYETQWGDPLTVDWVTHSGNSVLQATITPIDKAWGALHTGAFVGENWNQVVAVKADIFYEGGTASARAKLEVRGADGNVIQEIVQSDLVVGQSTPATWTLDQSNDFSNVSYVSIIVEGLTGTMPIFYFDDFELQRASGDTLWDDADDPGLDWQHSGSNVDWNPGHLNGEYSPVSLNGENASNAGSLYLNWNYTGGDNFAELFTNQLDGINDWSQYNRIRANVKITDQNAPVSVFFWDADASRGFATQGRKVTAANQWQTLQWDIPWPSGFDSSDVDELKFIVNNVHEHTSGTMFVDNILAIDSDLPAPVGGLEYEFLNFDRVTDKVSEFGSNWFYEPGFSNSVVTTGGAENSSGALTVNYNLTPNQSASAFYSLWGDARYKQTTIDFNNIFGATLERKNFDQIEFWVRGSGGSGFQNVKVELKDGTDQADRTAYRYIRIDNSNTNWQRIVLDADVTNSDFWIYNAGTPDSANMKFLSFVVEHQYNAPASGNAVGTFQIDNVSFHDADDQPFDPQPTSRPLFLIRDASRVFCSRHAHRR